MQGDLTTPVQTTQVRVRIIGVQLRRFPDDGFICVQLLDADGTVLETRTVPMRGATLSALYAATAFRNAIRSDVEAAIGQALTNVSG